MTHKFIYPRLEEWLHQNERSLTWLAKEVGVSRHTLWYYVKGMRNIPYWVARKIAEIAGTSTDELFTAEKQP